MLGGRKLWDSKDDQAWVHDRFEEMVMHDGPYEVIAHDSFSVQNQAFLFPLNKSRV